MKVVKIYATSFGKSEENPMWNLVINEKLILKINIK